MMEKSNSQYDSFLFWRQPIPALDLSELEDLGLTVGQPARSIKGDKSTLKRTQDDEVGEQVELCWYSLPAQQDHVYWAAFVDIF